MIFWGVNKNNEVVSVPKDYGSATSGLKIGNEKPSFITLNKKELILLLSEQQYASKIVNTLK